MGSKYVDNLDVHIKDTKQFRGKVGGKTQKKTKKRTKRRSKCINTHNKLFNKYSKNNEYLTKRECIHLMKNEYKLNYNNSIIVSFLNIWGKKINGNYVIMKDTFPKLFKGPNGFLRDYK